MARKSTIERREEQRVAYMHQSFDQLLEDVRVFATHEVRSLRDAFGTRSERTREEQLIFSLLCAAEEVCTKRISLTRDMQYLSSRLLEDVERIGRGRNADDVTRNSTFTNLAADTAIFNHMLRDVSMRCESACVFIVELYPSKTVEQLRDIVARAKTLAADMKLMTQLDEVSLAECRQKFTDLQREMR